MGRDGSPHVRWMGGGGGWIEQGRRKEFIKEGGGEGSRFKCSVANCFRG